MIPAKLNIVCPQGSSLIRDFNIYDETGAPADLTGYTASMQVRKTYKSTATLVDLVSPTDISISGNTIIATIHYSVTETFLPGDYVWDIEITSPLDVRERILQGKFIVTPEVTR